ncbi:transcription factor grauzone-like [Anopheles aquasalis]|uniref:transcription factor grauzone-like n=1 Tax=Anopheles aquasalis TaxID=42839 RepID=UPI00215A4939|nr:transcription factor grauzone-like [Anopheles aquasalis]
MDRCRLCIVASSSLSGVVSIEEESFRYKIESIFQLQFEITANLPSRVCDECFRKVDEFYDYAQEVRKAQTLLIEEDKETQVQFVDIQLAVEKNDERNEEYSSSHLYEDTIDGTDDIREDCLEQSINDDEDLVQLKSKEYEKDNDESGEDDEACQDEQLDDKTHLSALESSKADAVDPKLEDPKKRSMKQKSARIREEDERLKQFYSMTCEICSVQLKSFLLLQRHCREVHNQRGYVECCDRKFYRRFKLIDHLSLHTTPDAFRCEQCQKNYKSRSTLQHHQQLCHGEAKEKLFQCDKCHNSYSKSYQLKMHMKRHIQAPCELCGKVLSCQQSLRVHVRHMHGGEDEKLICDTCGQQFRTKPALERHVQQHLGVAVPVDKRQCPQCSVWVSGIRGLRMHLRNVHPAKDAVFECEICHKRCKNAMTLDHHRKGVHAEDKYECDICGKRFKRPIYLKEHRALHTGECLYSCDICGLAMNSNGNMYAHKKSKHPKEWQEAQRRKKLAAAPEAQHCTNSTQE